MSHALVTNRSIFLCRFGSQIHVADPGVFNGILADHCGMRETLRILLGQLPWRRFAFCECF